MAKEKPELWIKAVLEKEKKKLSVSLQGKISSVFLPVLRIRMDYKIKSSLNKYRIFGKIGNYPQTLQKTLELACQVYLIDQASYKKNEIFLGYLSCDEHLALLEKCGDLFSAAILHLLLENTNSVEDARSLENRFKSCIKIYQPPEIMVLYKTFQRIAQQKHKGDELDLNIHFVGSIDRLARNQELLKKYIAFFAQSSSASNLPKIFKSLHSVCLNIGTKKSYEIFIQFCEKCYGQVYFEKLLAIAEMVSELKSPEIFQQVFFWASTSSLPPDIYEKVLLILKQLICEGKDALEYKVFVLEKYIQYATKQESQFLSMGPEKTEYYLKKAVDVLVE